MPHFGELAALLYEASKVAEYASQYDYIDATTSYLGEALPGSAGSAAVWRIRKLVVTGSDVATTWADGNASFDNVWDSRLSLSYS